MKGMNVKTLLDKGIDVDEASKKIANIVYGTKGNVDAILMNASMHLFFIASADLTDDVPKVTIGNVEIPWPVSGETNVEYAERIKAAILEARSTQGAV